MKKFDDELVSGSIVRSVWKLAWPVTLLNLVNGLHGFVDHVLIGHYIESTTNAGNAAIGAAWQVFLVIVVFIASLFHGMNVLISRYAGKQDRDNMSRVAYESFLAAVYILVLIVGPIGYLLSSKPSPK
jgi:Na+-driven multidrug efflux pump